MISHVKKKNLCFFLFYMWVRSRNCGCLVTWFCYHVTAKPGNKTAAPSWPDPYSHSIYSPDDQVCVFCVHHQSFKYCLLSPLSIHHIETWIKSYSVECHYSAVKHDMVLHMLWQWLRQNSHCEIFYMSLARGTSGKKESLVPLNIDWNPTLVHIFVPFTSHALGLFTTWHEN